MKDDQYAINASLNGTNGCSNDDDDDDGEEAEKSWLVNRTDQDSTQSLDLLLLLIRLFALLKVPPRTNSLFTRLFPL
jgi:hypothetical protein